MLNTITDIASSPLVSIPLGLGTATANLIALLPIAINFVMLFYFIILVSHKLWVWWKEAKGTLEIKDDE